MRYDVSISFITNHHGYDHFHDAEYLETAHYVEIRESVSPKVVLRFTWHDINRIHLTELDPA